MKIIKILFLWVFSFHLLHAVNIELDGTITTISGTDCGIATYRLGTDASYGGHDLDLLVEVPEEDNEYADSACVGISNNVLSLRIKDRDPYDTLAYVNLKITVVEKNTLTPVTVDRLNITNFDLDRSNTLSSSGTDDVYYKNPSKIFLSEFTNVTKSTGTFYNQYTTKLKGQSTGNCNDSATLTTLECRAGVQYNNTSTFYTRVQNDNAYSIYTNYSYVHRLIQFSFEIKDLTPLMGDDVELSCGTSYFSSTSNIWIEGTTSSTYNNNLNTNKKLTMLDAEQLKITVTGNTEGNYDWVSVYDENETEYYKSSGTLDSTSFIIPSSELVLQLTSDGSVRRSGATVKIEGIGCFEDPQISIESNPSIVEGDSGTKDLIFNINLDNPAPQDITFTYSLTDINATFGEDYQEGTIPQGQIITIPKDSNSTTISVVINGDTQVENNETFTLKLENITNAIFTPESISTIGTIINDDQEIQPELVANYTFDACIWKGNQGEVKDSSSNGYHGKAVGGATTQKEHKINRSGIFKSANNQYVTIDGFDDIFGTTNNEFSFTAWIKPNNLSSAKTNHQTQNTLFAKASDSYNDNIEIGVNQNGTLHLYLDTNLEDTYKEFGESGDIDTNNWHFIAVSYKNGIVEITIDDKQYTDSTTWASATNIDQANNSPVTIGASINVDNFFDGAIDELKIFSTALNTNQVSEILTNEESGKNWDGTIRDSVEDECNIEPTGCITTAFMFQGRTDVYALNLANGDMSSIQNEPINIQNINAVGFNKKDGFFWGYNYDKQNGTIAKIGMLSSGIWSTEEIKIEGLEGFSSYVGDVNSNGHLYLKGSGNSRQVVVIDLDPDSSTYLTKIRDFNLNFDLGTADWAFNPIDNKLYAVNNGSSTKYLYKIDPSNGHKLSNKDTLLTGSRSFGAGFFDANGFYYVYDNNTGEIFRIDISNNSSKAVLFSTTNIVSLNDGAMCTDAKFKFDFGDLPDNYPTLLENDGARHSLPTYGESSIYLGSDVTHEDNGKPSINATLDTNDDGVKLNGGSLQDKTIDAGATTTLTITTHGEGYLSAWIDWNADGDFDDDLEQIANNVDGSDGVINLSFTAPSSTIDRTTYARFRYSYQQDLDPTGSAINGEVEDYKIDIHGNLEPFTCDGSFYLSNRTLLGTGDGDSGATWLHSFSAMGTTYTPIGAGFTSDNGGYNAIGYNVQDNYIYALYGNELLKIDKNANIKNLGAITGLPNTQLYAGEFDRNGYYYVSGGGADNKMYKIDIAQKKVIDTIPLSQSVRFWDMAIDTTGEYFYTMLIQYENSDYTNNKFAKIKISDGTITPIGELHNDLPSYISLIFSDAEGKVIAVAQDGKMYEIMPQSGKIYLTRPFPALSFYNDGTSCPDANVTLPPHIPRLSIGDVTKAEGDSGETMFEFELSIDADLPMIPIGMPTMFFYKVLDGDNNDITMNAFEVDHDFHGGSGIAMNMDIFSNNRSQTISVPVYGDKKVEKDEEFYVEIYFPDFFPSNFVIMGKDRGVGTILNDDMKFKVVRTGEIEDDSLYTQITGRDFNYTILYDGDMNIEDVSLKIELIDNNNSTNNILYKGYKYIENGNSVDVMNNSDLALLRATKDASFRVYFLKDENGTIAHGDYANEQDYSSEENRVGYTQVAQESSDHFAIRPANFLINIKDLDENNNSVLYRTNDKSYSTPLNLVAGHPYIIEVNATLDNTNQKTELYTTGDMDSKLIFNSSASCNDEDNRTMRYSFINGSFSSTISNNNVGNYILDINDSKWTIIDQDENNLGCILGSASNSADNSGKVGCDITANSLTPNLEFKFKPFRFDIDNSFSNIHNNNKDYLYMSDLNRSIEMGVKLRSTLKAVGEDDIVLTNFTKSCMENDANLSLGLDFSFEADSLTFRDGNFTSISGKVLSPQQIVEFNDENNDTVMNMSDINISQKFLDENNGSMTINIFYNMQKLFNEPTNPIKVDFLSLDLKTTHLEAKIKGKDKEPIGKGDITEERIFYFARVSSYLKNYPPTNKTSIETPLFVEVYCQTKTSTQKWCRETMKLDENNITYNGQKTYKGWYLATQHDSTTEGKVLSLTTLSDKIKIDVPTPIPSFDKGKINNIKIVAIANTISEEFETEIKVVTSEWLRFNKQDKNKDAYYNVTFKPAGDLIGISNNKDGDIGYNLMRAKDGSLNGMVEKNGKMSW